MQRLFSMFPNGWPGTALLLLRLVAGILLINNGIVALVSGVAVRVVFVQSVGIGGGILLILGLWTPIAGLLVAIVEICLMFPGTAEMQSNILLGTLGAAFVALGPGVRSLDSLLYGRKRVTFP
jgi:putative oxidoreductase